MEKVRYMISDAAGIVGVETHVLRYWEDELELAIPRNEMGHRYYTRDNIQEFKQIRDLKEKGYQLKAIRAILHSPPADSDTAEPAAELSPGLPLSADERMAQFRELMSDIVGRAIAQNNDELTQSLNREVKETVLKEMNYLFREQSEAEEERFRKLDAAIRGKLRKKHSFFSKKEEKNNSIPTTQTT